MVLAAKETDSSVPALTREQRERRCSRTLTAQLPAPTQAPKYLQLQPPHACRSLVDIVNIIMLSLSSILRSAALTALPRLQGPRTITTTAVMCAMPPKKKKKMDVQLVKLRHERKVRKVEKAIRQLKKTPRQLKPIEEYALPPAIVRQLEMRTRPQTEEDRQVEETLAKLKRLWLSYKSMERIVDQRNLKQVIAAQNRALAVLQSESPRLYEAAVSLDPNLIPFQDEFMLTETAPNPEYVPPDGVKVDVSKVWTM